MSLADDMLDRSHGSEKCLGLYDEHITRIVEEEIKRRADLGYTTAQIFTEDYGIDDSEEAHMISMALMEQGFETRIFKMHGHFESDSDKEIEAHLITIAWDGHPAPDPERSSYI